MKHAWYEITGKVRIAPTQILNSPGFWSRPRFGRLLFWPFFLKPAPAPAPEDIDFKNFLVTITDLRGVRKHRSRYLTSRLHALVLHGCDVLEPWWRHIPVQGGLLPAGRLLLVAWAGPTALPTRRPLLLTVPRPGTLFPVLAHLK